MCSYNEEEKRPFSILRPSKNEDAKNKVTNIVFKNEDTSHYAWISKFNTLMRSEVTKHKTSYEFCLRCLWHFPTKEKLEKHLEDCIKFDAARIVMPKGKDGKPPYISFDCKKLKKKQKLPRVVFSDMEAKLTKLDTCQPNPNKSYTQQYQKHDIISWGYCMVPSDDDLFEPVMRRRTAEDEEEDMDEDYLKSLGATIKQNLNTVNYNVPLDKKTIDWVDYNNATECHICEGMEGPLDEDRVMDHDHTTGKYSGSAHNKCNMVYRLSNLGSCHLL
mgnify:CR=1 FL=1